MFHITWAEHTWIKAFARSCAVALPVIMWNDLAGYSWTVSPLNSYNTAAMRTLLKSHMINFGVFLEQKIKLSFSLEMAVEGPFQVDALLWTVIENPFERLGFIYKTASCIYIKDILPVKLMKKADCPFCEQRDFDFIIGYFDAVDVTKQPAVALPEREGYLLIFKVVFLLQYK